MPSKYLQPNYEKSFNQRFREKRFMFFKGLLNKVSSDQPIRILDIGGTESYWERMKMVDNHQVHITLLNLYDIEVKNKNFSSVVGDACSMPQYSDREFDIVYSNSVIEHLFTKDNQVKMANEVRRVGKNYYIQTPNYYFPIEPHWLFPFFQFFPKPLRVALTRNFSLGNYKKSPTWEKAIERVEEVKLLTAKEMNDLFPEGEIYMEKFLGMTKSITMHYFPDKVD